MKKVMHELQLTWTTNSEHDGGKKWSQSLDVLSISETADILWFSLRAEFTQNGVKNKKTSRQLMRMDRIVQADRKLQ